MSLTKQEKKHKEESISNLEMQRLQALANNDTKTANLIQKIITMLSNKKQK
jgi:hypothetical protein